MKFIHASSSLVGCPTKTRNVGGIAIFGAIVLLLNNENTDFVPIHYVMKSKTFVTVFNNTNTHCSSLGGGGESHVHVGLDNEAVKANQETNNTNITKSFSSSSSSSSASSTLNNNNSASSIDLIHNGGGTAAGTSSSSLTEVKSSSLSCLEKRGSNGHWVQDWDYAKRTDYMMHGSHANWHLASQGFHATPEQPFRLAMSWKWQDDECPVHEISLPGFCQACTDLDITRLVILGDSLSVEFMYSILHLLGFIPQGEQIIFNMPFQISCTAQVAKEGSRSNEQFFITLWVFRKKPFEQVVNLRNDTILWDYVKNNPNRTAIIANTGAWMGNIEQYTLAFQSILDWIDSFPDPSKIIAFFRPTIPGHVNCLPHGNKIRYNWTIPVNEAPFLDYQDYLKTTMDIRNKNKTIYNWFNFEAYNAHSQALLQNRTKAAAAAAATVVGGASPFNNDNNDTNHGNTSIPPAALAPIHWLNVFNSTILRRDGHVGFNDCLHYYIPGPIDWWVHFFYSMLLDLAKTDEKRGDVANIHNKL